MKNDSNALEHVIEKCVAIFELMICLIKKLGHICESMENRYALKQFQDKWALIIRPELQLNQDLEHLSDSIETKNAPVTA